MATSYRKFPGFSYFCIVMVCTMGYDFLYIRLKKLLPRYPCPYEFNFYEEIQPLPPLQVLANILLTYHEVRPNGCNESGASWYLWKTPDGGSLDFQLSSDRLTIGIDTHAHWQFVLEMLHYLQVLCTDLLILDAQTLLLYDADSYEIFLRQNYE